MSDKYIQTDGDMFHEIYSTGPHHVHIMTPENIKGCDMREGEFGKVGSTFENIVLVCLIIQYKNI